MNPSFHTCQPGYESHLVNELAGLGLPGAVGADGAVLVPAATRAETALADLCFARVSVFDVHTLTGPSVNSLAGALCDLACEAFRGATSDTPWCLHLAAPPDSSVAGRLRTVRAEFIKRLKGRMARVAKQVCDEPPVSAMPVLGLGVWFTGFDHCLAGTRLRSWGQQRMRWDARAPSRSFLKIEEAFALLDVAPATGERVVDLGAAPGGWSFAAAKRGAHVLAVDNGPLKGAALEHPSIDHRREDAFRFRPDPDEVYDWLLCDLVEDPWHVLEHILLPWVERGWCRRFIVNLKMGRCDPQVLLTRLRNPGPGGLAAVCKSLVVRHLYHDREEITCSGETR